MKILSTLLLTLAIASMTFAQDIKSDVSSAFKSGNSKSLAEHFTSTLDLVVSDNDDVYSKVQAEQILRKFFESHSPTSFKIIHDGESRSGTKYFIGELETSNGSYRVTINMKAVSGAQKIHQLRIE